MTLLVRMMARWPIVVGSLAVLCSCGVISRDVRQKTDPPVPFEMLMENTDEYIGKTVILGGYIIRTMNTEKQTVISILQAPLRLGEEPAPREKSQGRFMVTGNGFLDPEVYQKDRLVTVAGTVKGKIEREEDGHLYVYLMLNSIEIYLWPQYRRADVYRCYDPWFYGRFYGGSLWRYGGPWSSCAPFWRY